MFKVPPCNQQQRMPYELTGPPPSLHPSSVDRGSGNAALSMRTLNLGDAQTISMVPPTFQQLQQRISVTFSAPAHFLSRKVTYWSRSDDDYWSQPGDESYRCHTVSQTQYRAHPRVELAQAEAAMDVDNFGLITRYTQKNLAETVLVCEDEWSDSIFQVVIYEQNTCGDTVCYDNSGVLKFRVSWGSTISSNPIGDLYVGQTRLAKELFPSVAQLFTTLLNHEYNTNGRYAYKLWYLFFTAHMLWLQQSPQI